MQIWGPGKDLPRVLFLLMSSSDLEVRPRSADPIMAWAEGFFSMRRRCSTSMMAAQSSSSAIGNNFHDIRYAAL